MEATSSNGVSFAQPLLTQPQQWDGGSDRSAEGDADSSTGDCKNDDEMNGSDVSNIPLPPLNSSAMFEVDEDEGGEEVRDCGDGQDGANNGSAMFEVDEDGGGDANAMALPSLAPIDGCGDGFKLLTQSNELFNENDDDSSATESGSDSSDGGSSGSDSGESDSDSSAEEEETNAAKTLQERREQNIQRNRAFVDILKSEMTAMMMGGKVHQQHHRKKRKVEGGENHAEAPEKDAGDQEETARRKRRGMIFTTLADRHQVMPPPTTSSKPYQSHVHLCAKSLEDELNLNYPHQSNQIHLLCSQLVSIVKKSKFAWKMANNVQSSGGIQYSEASYQGDIKLAAPSPIMITGSSGCGKTSIVRDAVLVLRRRISEGGEAGTISKAYVDCASSESGSVAAVMNSAYKQLFECYHPSSGFGRYGKSDTKEKHHFHGEISRLTLGGADFAEDGASDGGGGDDSDAYGEDLLERQRNRARRRNTVAARGKRTKGGLTSSQSQNPQKIARQTRLSASLAAKQESEAAPKSSGLNSIPSSSNRNTQNSSSVSLFGRATSALIQAGNASRKKAGNERWRCAFLVLDNAERILSWKKHGSVTPLTQIFLLPNIMGINLTLIFISRSTIFHHSPVQHPPGTLLDAVHPQTIHFGSYTSVDTIKSILNTPRVKQSIIGAAPFISDVACCNHATTIKSTLRDMLYTSMLNTFVPSVRSSTLDIAEITRLARLLWPEYLAPLNRNDGVDDSSLETLLWQNIGCLWRDSESLAQKCDSDCKFCSSMGTNGTSKDSARLDINALRQRLSEKLDKNIRESMRSLLSFTAMMPGRVLAKQSCDPYAGRLPYITKFLLLAAFLCQNKRPEQDRNLYTTQNTGKSKKNRKSDEGTAYAASSKDLALRQPSFPLERMLSVFSSIIGQYGQTHYVIYKEEGSTVGSQLGTERLFQSVSQLIAMGLLQATGGVKLSDKHANDLMELTAAKFVCPISREDTLVIAGSVGFPLEKYVPI